MINITLFVCQLVKLENRKKFTIEKEELNQRQVIFIIYLKILL